MNITSQLPEDGTRFRVFCQPRYLFGWSEPEIITVKPRAGSITRGPRDDRITVVDARDKPTYDRDTYPPYRGPLRTVAEPGPDGHFDHLDPDSREFRAAHAYAVLRMVLDIWEDYSGEKTRWFFEHDYRRLEVIPSVNWDNGQAGYGYIELGHSKGLGDLKHPFALNFDVLAHEMGHVLIASNVGVPESPDETQYAGFQESASDLIALISLLHFETFRTSLLSQTAGNLYAPNELNRLAELSDNTQIRTASHSLKMSDIDYAWVPAKRLTQKQIHHQAEPFTGAVFDILVEIFQARLVETGAISIGLDELSSNYAERDAEAIQQQFFAAYIANHILFEEALIYARDVVGQRLITSWRRLDVETLSLFNAAREFLTVDRELSGQKYQALVVDCFKWRNFTPRP